MVAHDVPLLRHAADDGRVGCGPFADAEESRRHAPLPEQVEEGRSGLGIRAVVERQRDQLAPWLPTAAGIDEEAQPQRHDARPKHYGVYPGHNAHGDPAAGGSQETRRRDKARHSYESGQREAAHAVTRHTLW